MTDDEASVVEGAVVDAAAGRLVEDEVVEPPVALGTEVPHPAMAIADTATTIHPRRRGRCMKLMRSIRR